MCAPQIEENDAHFFFNFLLIVKACGPYTIIINNYCPNNERKMHSTKYGTSTTSIYSAVLVPSNYYLFRTWQHFLCENNL